MIQLSPTRPHEQSIAAALLDSDEDLHVRNDYADAAEPQGDELPSAAQVSSAEATKLQNSLKARKRTKTGCLTCRKRRIKCGEERPTCANCIKSKRSCEGYAPRLTFKDPLGAFRPGWAVKGHGAHYENFSHSNGAIGQYARQITTPGTHNQLPVIAPRPLPMAPPSDMYPPHTDPTSPWPAGTYNPSQNGMQNPIQPSNDLPPRMRQMYEGNSSRVTTQYPHVRERTDHSAPSYISQPSPQPYPTQDSLRYYGEQPSVSHWPVIGGSDDINDLRTPASAGFINAVPAPASTEGRQDDNQSQQSNHADQGFANFVPVESSAQPKQSLYKVEPDQGAQYFSSTMEGMPEFNDYTRTADGGRFSYVNGDFTRQLPPYQLGDSYTEVFQKQMLFEKLRQHQLMDFHEEVEDELFDVESEDEVVPNTNHTTSTPQNDVGLMLALAASQDDRVLRSYTTFLNEPNVLSTYQPVYTASPLMDSTTARVFCHFITATGPSISIYERHPTNPSVMFTGAPVPSSQQALWTYTLPMKALSNQALLHAMLAIASLHISALQKTPPTASLRHYHFALRRLTKTLSIPSKRTDIGTIAATLILGHYEATTAEHSKWNRHLAGARQLLMEVDFKGTTKQINELRARRDQQQKNPSWYASGGAMMNYHNFQQNVEPPRDNLVDEILVSRLMGWKIKYNEYGQVVDDYIEHPRPPITEKDIETYKIHCDLFWWYAKQDVYQSVVSGNGLLLPYDRWGHCPPRAPIGKLEAIYGTMDHLVLLMGRIADFASKDQLRKRKVMKLNGGQWRPPPGMFPSPPMGGPSPFFNQAQNSPPRMGPQATQPPMYGMIPTVPIPQTPERFMQAPRDQIYIPPTIDEDNLELENATAQAEIEWREIQVALDLFEESLGPGYASLPDYLAPPFQTPFGVALQYRTWSIACIWVMFYTGRIIAARMHPSMPPAAIMSAGVAASQTAHWAKKVGQICCGLQTPPSDQPLNPAVGAALMESTLGMFFAGVQYTDPIQRSTIINRLLTIAEMTGLQSSALIAAGCELCWIKMGEAGRGPPYTATMDKKAKDDRVAGRPAPKGNELDRQLVYVHPGTRTHYAMGIMSFDSDFLPDAVEKLSLELEP